MEQLLLWEKFKKSGKIEDYLKYVMERDSTKKYIGQYLENKAK